MSEEWTRCSLKLLPREMRATAGANDMRIYQRDVSAGEYLEVFVAREPLRKDGGLAWHLSIALKSKLLPGYGSRLPTWEEITNARYKFCPGDLTMTMHLPPKNRYVDFHKTTMHLFEDPGLLLD